VNRIRPTRTKKEYYEENKEIIKNNVKEYRLNNKDKCDENDKNKRLKNPEKYKKIQETYRKKHKAEMQEKRAIKYICECGSKCSILDKNRHLRTEKHVYYMNSIKSKQDEMNKLEEEFDNYIIDIYNNNYGNIMCDYIDSNKLKKDIYFLKSTFFSIWL
jgi:hypothetical protein